MHIPKWIDSPYNCLFHAVFLTWISSIFANVLDFSRSYELEILTTRYFVFFKSNQLSTSIFNKCFWIEEKVSLILRYICTYGFCLIYQRVSRATGASSRYLYFGSIGSPSAPESIERCSWVKVTPKLAGSMGPKTIGKIQVSHVRS